MNEFNVLLNAATNGTHSGSLFDALFARYIAPQESWRELESPLPITILAAGEDLIDYRIYGNTVQTGTPTPENPIVPSGCGERTENLFDINKLHSSITVEGESFTKPDSGFNFDIFSGTSGSSNPIDENKSMFLKAGEYVATVGEHSSTIINIARVNGNEELAIIASISATQSSLSFTLNYDSYVTVRISKAESLTISNLEISAGLTIPTRYEPYGYKLPMVVRSGNLFDGQGTDNYGYYDNANGLYVNSQNYKYWRFPVKEGDIIRWTTTGAGYGCYFSNGVYKGNFKTHNTPFTVPADVDEITNNFERSTWGSAIVTLNQPLPDQYIPYYRDEENIYIGSDPLAEDEYVDFGEQKIYRKVNGILTPTDPPVPIPALPTIDGETIIDYNPSETPAVEPEKMYIKYKPQ